MFLVNNCMLIGKIKNFPHIQKCYRVKKEYKFNMNKFYFNFIIILEEKEKKKKKHRSVPPKVVE